MKKLFLFLLFIGCIITYCSGQTYVDNYQKINADTVTKWMQFKTPFTTPAGYLLKTGLLEITIVIDSDNTGTLQFAIAPKGTAYPIRSTAQTFAASDGKIVTTIYVPTSSASDYSAVNLYYKGSTTTAANSSFTVIY